MGDIFTAAMKSGLSVDYVVFDHGFTTDIGTHDEMKDYLKKSLQ